MSFRRWFGGLSDIVIRWRVSVRLDLGDLEIIERMKSRHDVESNHVMRRALAIYSKFVLAEYPALFMRLSDGSHAPWILGHEKPHEFHEPTAWSYSFLVSRQAYRRLCRVRDGIGAEDFTPLVRNALTLLARVAEGEMPRLYVRNVKGEYEEYFGLC